MAEKPAPEEPPADLAADDADGALAPAGDPNAPAETYTLGLSRYLYTGYFVLGCVVAFTMGKVLDAFLPEASDVGGGLWGVVIGGHRQLSINLVSVLVGLAAVLYCWKKDSIRTTAWEIIEELARVTWPTRQETYTATTVVIITSIISAALIFFYDRFWNWLTDLVYLHHGSG